jgi:sugar phosphate isomerase/epimerase
MRLQGRPGLGHLTYCTNIHPGETWDLTFESIQQHLLPVRRALAPEQPFGVGLRLSAVAAEALREPSTFVDFRAFLAHHDLYVFTLNGFPFGPFHGTRVKEEVYQPDWLHEERLAYTNLLADLLAQLLPDEEGLDGSISTVPGTFRPLAARPGAIERMAQNLVRHVAHLIDILERSGRTIALALEPEPMCFLETIDETAAFFEQHLFAPAAVRQLHDLTGLSTGDAEAALRRHLGVCYDVCHAAVEFEDPAASLERLRGAGIAIPKLQLSSALRIAEATPEAAEHLWPFDDGVYLHQVVERGQGGLVRHLDLPQALDALAAGSEWRVHFHVPVFMERLEHFGTTQAFLGEILARHRREPISAHLEVETYTFGVLPEAYRREPVSQAITRELAWARDQLGA